MIQTPNTVAQLTALSERVQSAAGPRRHLDGLAWKIITEKSTDVWRRDRQVWVRVNPFQNGVTYETPRLTCDFEATETMFREHFGHFEYELKSPNGPGPQTGNRYQVICRAARTDASGRAKTATLALLAAGLSLSAAVIAQ